MNSKKNSKDEIKRINIRIPEYVQDWYKEQGEKYSVPYTNYMAMLLTQIYEQGQEKELAIQFNNTLKDMQTTAGDITVEEMMSQIQEMKSLIKVQKD